MTSARVGLPTIAVRWGRIGVTGFGGPPAHIALLRKLCVQDRQWISDHEFEDGIAAANLLPGPASTQLAIFCAWRLRGWVGGLVGGVCFILPGLIVILALAALLLAGHPALPVLGAAAGAGAAVPAVAVQAATSLMPPSMRRAAEIPGGKIRWYAYALAGGLAAVFLGPWLVLVLVAAGAIEVLLRQGPSLPRARSGDDTDTERRDGAPAVPKRSGRTRAGAVLFGVPPGALAWTALKVGALSYGGGFVIIPLMRSDAVTHYHWLTGDQFLYAVALGQVTPGPVVQTVAVVGYAAAGITGGIVASAVAFAPSFAFVLGGGRHFDRLRGNAAARAFLGGAGPAAIGAIAGSAVQLGFTLNQPWEAFVVAGAVLWIFVLRRGVVSALLLAAAAGAALAQAGVAVT